MFNENRLPGFQNESKHIEDSFLYLDLDELREKGYKQLKWVKFRGWDNWNRECSAKWKQYRNWSWTTN